MSQNFYTNVAYSYDKKAFFISGVFGNVRKRAWKKYVPELFLELSREEYALEDKSSTFFKTMKGGIAVKKNFNNIFEFHRFKKEYPSNKIHGDIGIEYQFLREHFSKDIKYDLSKINIVYFDIETLRLDENEEETGFPDPFEVPKPIVSVSFIHSFSKEILVYGLKDFDLEKSSYKDNKDFIIKYFQFSKEEEMLKAILEMIASEKYYPDILCGYNSFTFDVPYLINRCYKFFGEEYTSSKLSPTGKIDLKIANVKTVRGFEQEKGYKIHGVQHIDYLRAIKKFNILKDTASFSLNDVSDLILGDVKVDYSDFGTLQDLFFKDHQLFIDYNIKDTELLYKIENVKKIFDIIFSISYISKCLPEDTLGTIGAWDCAIYNELYKDNVCIPPRQKDVQGEKIEGGYVKETIAGHYEYLTVFDFASLYPNITIMANMCPSTIVDDISIINNSNLQKYSKTPMNVFFDNSKQGYCPKILEGIYNLRKISKKEMLSLKTKNMNNIDEKVSKEIDFLSAKEQALKIFINSFYGACCSIHFRYYDIRIASSITAFGRNNNRLMMKNLNDYMNELNSTRNHDYIVFGDTDSCGVDLGDYVKNNFKDLPKEKIIEKIIEIYQNEFLPIIKKTSSGILKEFNLFKDVLDFELEVIADKAFFKAKKRYFLNKYYEDGRIYKDSLNIKITGLEAVKRALPKFLKDGFKKLYVDILYNDNDSLMKNFDSIEDEFYSCEVDKIAKVISVKDVRDVEDGEGDYLKKGDTNQLKASMNYNLLLQRYGLLGKYPQIQQKDNVKIVPLKKKNPYGFQNIAFIKTLPKEFRLDEYVDRKYQFEKLFKTPLEELLTIRKWNLLTGLEIDDIYPF